VLDCRGIENTAGSVEDAFFVVGADVPSRGRGLSQRCLVADGDGDGDAFLKDVCSGYL